MEKLERRLGSEATTSDKPPLTDSPFEKSKEKSRRKPGGKKGHQGHPQQMLEPTKTVAVTPRRCQCGHSEFGQLSPLHTHQVIEFPEIRMEVPHFVLYEGRFTAVGSKG